MKLYLTMTGVPELRRAIGDMTPELRTRLKVVVQSSAHRIAAGARSRVPVGGALDPHPGELRDTIRVDSAAGGMVAFIKAGYGTLRRRSRARTGIKGAKHRRIRRAATSAPGIYAMVVEFGSTTHAAHPFLFPAIEAERGRFALEAEDALAAAIDSAVRNAGADRIR